MVDPRKLYEEYFVKNPKSMIEEKRGSMSMIRGRVQVKQPPELKLINFGSSTNFSLNESGQIINRQGKQVKKSRLVEAFKQKSSQQESAGE